MKSNWITATIDDVCTVVTDGAHNSPKSVEQGHYMASVKDLTSQIANRLAKKIIKNFGIKGVSQRKMIFW